MKPLKGPKMRGMMKCERASIAALTALSLLWSGSLALAGDQPAPRASAAEKALMLFANPVARRVVVRGEDQRLDVWLVSKQPFTKTGERLRKAAEVKLQLPGGHVVARATWLDPDRTWWVDLQQGGDAARVEVSRHRGGTLFVLRGKGHSQDAGPWAPGYRPRPLNLPHGPIRP